MYHPLLYRNPGKAHLNYLPLAKLVSSSTQLEANGPEGLTALDIISPTVWYHL